MRVVRALTLASVVLFVSAGAVLTLVLVSPALLEIEAGEPEVSRVNDKLLVRVPLTITNRGLLGLEGLEVSYSLRDSAGRLLLEGAAGPLDVPGGGEATLVLEAELRGVEELLFKDQELLLEVRVSSGIGGLSSISLVVKASVDWGAPLSGFSVGEPRIEPLNLTHVRLVAPVTMETRSQLFDLSVLRGARIKLVDEGGALVGSGGFSPQPLGRKYNGFVVIDLRTGLLPAELLFQDKSLVYDLVVEITGGPLGGVTVSRRIEIEWAAPLSSLEIGEPRLLGYRDGALVLEVPVSFENKSPFIDLVGEIELTLIDERGVVVGTGLLDVEAPRLSSFRGAAEILLEVEGVELVFEDAELRYRLVATGLVSGFRVGFERDLSITWGAPLSGLSMGEPSLSILNSTHVEVVVPFSFKNRSGFIDVDTSVVVEIIDVATGVVAGGAEVRVRANRGEEFRGSAAIPLRVGEDRLRELLVADDVLDYRVVLRGGVGGLLFERSSDLRLVWLAPLSGLEVTSPVLDSVNATHVILSSTLGFTNKSPRAVRGLVEARVLNSTSLEELGGGFLEVEAPPNYTFRGEILLAIPVSKLPMDKLIFARAELGFKLVLKASVGPVETGWEKEVVVEWSPPISGLSVGGVEAQAYNATHAKLTIPVSFSNDSGGMRVRGALVLRVFNSLGEEVGSSGAMALDVEPGSGFSQEVVVFVDSTKLTREVVLRLEFKVEQGVFVHEEVVEIG